MKLTSFKVLLAVMIVTVPISVGFAANVVHDLNTKANWNQLEIHNNTDKPIYYKFGIGYKYRVAPFEADRYHSKGFDSSTHFNTSSCEDEQFIPEYGWFCHKKSELCNLGANKYNADLIKRIDINGVNQCVVTCLDGSSSSCLLK